MHIVSPRTQLIIMMIIMSPPHRLGQNALSVHLSVPYVGQLEEFRGVSCCPGGGLRSQSALR